MVFPLRPGITVNQVNHASEAVNREESCFSLFSLLVKSKSKHLSLGRSRQQPRLRCALKFDASTVVAGDSVKMRSCTLI